jgi:hypothetical protein
MRNHVRLRPSATVVLIEAIAAKVCGWLRPE